MSHSSSNLDDIAPSERAFYVYRVPGGATWYSDYEPHHSSRLTPVAAGTHEAMQAVRRLLEVVT